MHGWTPSQSKNAAEQPNQGAYSDASAKPDPLGGAASKPSDKNMMHSSKVQDVEVFLRQPGKDDVRAEPDPTGLLYSQERSAPILIDKDGTRQIASAQAKGQQDGGEAAAHLFDQDDAFKARHHHDLQPMAGQEQISPMEEHVYGAPRPQQVPYAASSGLEGEKAAAHPVQYQSSDLDQKMEEQQPIFMMHHQHHGHGDPHGVGSESLDPAKAASPPGGSGHLAQEGHHGHLHHGGSASADWQARGQGASGSQPMEFVHHQAQLGMEQDHMQYFPHMSGAGKGKVYMMTAQQQSQAQASQVMRSAQGVPPPEHLDADKGFDPHQMDYDPQGPPFEMVEPDDGYPQVFTQDGAAGVPNFGIGAGDSAENDARFHTLAELAEMEPLFQTKYYEGVNASPQHVILSPQEYRAKLYWLDQENKWKDIGTGRFRLLLSKDEIEHYIQIVSEDIEENGMPAGGGDSGSSAVLQSKQVFLHRCFVSQLQDFSRQGDTIITWQDDFKNEFALSFQDEKGAVNTWWSICFLKGTQINSNIDEQRSQGDSQNDNNSEENIINEEVSIPTKENLQDLVSELVVNDNYTRRTVAEAVLKSEESIQRGQNNAGSSDHLSDRDHSKLQNWRSLFLDKLQRIFNEVEADYEKAQKAMQETTGDEREKYNFLVQQTNYLHSLFQIFRNLLNLNQNELLEVLLNENYCMTTFGALEYDPELFNPSGGNFENQGAGSPIQSRYSQANSHSQAGSPRSNARSFGSFDNFEQANLYQASLQQEADFRDFLQNRVKFKQAVEISDPHVIYCIHLSYKLQYLKDTAMARYIDEQTSHTIMPLIASLHQLISDYIFGDEFERIQSELIAKMHDNTNLQDKENALKFFLEICSLLKSIQLTNRQLQTCNSGFPKIMSVLAQTYDIMVPDKHTLWAEVKQAKEELVSIFDQRSIKEQARAAAKVTCDGDQIETAQQDRAMEGQEIEAKGGPSKQEAPSAPPGLGEPTSEPEKAMQSSEVLAQEESPALQATQPAAQGATQSSPVHAEEDPQLPCSEDDWINPSRRTVEEYLKQAAAHEDPTMTQIDILKSNSIEIFYNLLLLLSNVNHSTIRDFLCNEFQKRQRYVFLRHLAQHMMYTSQQGIKVSICEFFKDLTSKETSEMQKTFQQIILFNVVSQFVEFLRDTDDVPAVKEAPAKDEEERAAGVSANEAAQAKDGQADEEMKEGGENGADKKGEKAPAGATDADMANEEEVKGAGESKISDDPRVLKKYRMQIDQSRVLILQFLTKLILDNVDTYQLRVFFFQKKVLSIVVSCRRFNSVQTNVEIIKFFKAIIQVKDTRSFEYMIKHDIIDDIMQIFLNNKKGNLLHSCILSLFEMLVPGEGGPGGLGLQGQGTSGVPVMPMDSYCATKFDGYIQGKVLNKLYNYLYEKGFAKSVFFSKEYEEGFKKFNRHMRAALDIHSEKDSKAVSDRDRSSSHQKVYQAHHWQHLAGKEPSDPSLQESPVKGQYAEGDDFGRNRRYEDEIEQACFPKQQQQSPPIEAEKGPSDAYLKKQITDYIREQIDLKEGEQDGEGGREAADAKEQEDKMAADSVVAKWQDSSLEAEERAEAGAAAAKDDDRVGLAPQKQGSFGPSYSEASDVGRASNRAARSMSPMSGHILQQEVSPTLDHVMSQPTTILPKSRLIDSNQPHNSPQGLSEAPPPKRPRRGSEDEHMPPRPSNISSGGLLNLSDDGSKGAVAGKANSAYSDSLSNPDLDEIFFNKHQPVPKPASQNAISFQIGGGQGSSSPAGAQKGSNPQLSPVLEPMSVPSIFQKASSNKHHLHKERRKRPKFDRGRRSNSENPPPRSSLPNFGHQEGIALNRGEEAPGDVETMVRKIEQQLSDTERLQQAGGTTSHRLVKNSTIDDLDELIGAKRRRSDQLLTAVAGESMGRGEQQQAPPMKRAKTDGDQQEGGTLRNNEGGEVAAPPE